jgi:hypothetical protein
VSFGGQTVTLRSVVLGSAGRMGIKAKTSASTTWAGVLFRPVQSTEPTGGNTDVITQMFKATGPATAAPWLRMKRTSWITAETLS